MYVDCLRVTFKANKFSMFISSHFAYPNRHTSQMPGCTINLLTFTFIEEAVGIGRERKLPGWLNTGPSVIPVPSSKLLMH